MHSVCGAHKLSTRPLRHSDAGSSFIFADEHDGDEKSVHIGADTLTIHPYNNNETWVVTSKLDRRFCNASIDFNVMLPCPP